MFEIKGGKMYITKGDDAAITVRIEEVTGIKHPIKSGDVVKLTVRDYVGGTVLATFSVTATSTTDDIVLQINHSSTASIPVGMYSADVQYVESGGGIYTIFPVFKEHTDELKMNGIKKNWQNFWVMPEITT